MFFPARKVGSIGSQRVTRCAESFELRRGFVQPALTSTHYPDLGTSLEKPTRHGCAYATATTAHQRDAIPEIEVRHMGEVNCPPSMRTTWPLM